MIKSPSHNHVSDYRFSRLLALYFKKPPSSGKAKLTSNSRYRPRSQRQRNCRRPGTNSFFSFSRSRLDTSPPHTRHSPNRLLTPHTIRARARRRQRAPQSNRPESIRSQHRNLHSRRLRPQSCLYELLIPHPPPTSFGVVGPIRQECVARCE